MPDQERLSYAPAGPGAVQPCWLCGIRLPADHMMADGGSACTDVRWYCLDKRGCTERWTARAASAGRPSHEQRRGAGFLGLDQLRAGRRRSVNRVGAGGLTVGPGPAAGR